MREKLENRPLEVWPLIFRNNTYLLFRSSRLSVRTISCQNTHAACAKTKFANLFFRKKNLIPHNAYSSSTCNTKIGPNILFYSFINIIAPIIIKIDRE